MLEFPAGSAVAADSSFSLRFPPLQNRQVPISFSASSSLFIHGAPERDGTGGWRFRCARRRRLQNNHDDGDDVDD